MRTSSPRPDETLLLLRAYKVAEEQLRLYIMGLLDGLGIERERFTGIDDETGDLILSDRDADDDEP